MCVLSGAPLAGRGSGACSAALARLLGFACVLSPRVLFCRAPVSSPATATSRTCVTAAEHHISRRRREPRLQGIMAVRILSTGCTISGNCKVIAPSVASVGPGPSAAAAGSTPLLPPWLWAERAACLCLLGAPPLNLDTCLISAVPCSGFELDASCMRDLHHWLHGIGIVVNMANCALSTFTSSVVQIGIFNPKSQLIVHAVGHDAPVGLLTRQSDASQYSRSFALRSAATAHSLLKPTGGAYIITCSCSST